MEIKYTKNYTINIIILVVILIFASLIEIQVWKESIVAGIFVAILFVGLIIYSITQIFVFARVKSVEVTSNTITINNRKTSIEIPFSEFRRLEYYKHGLLTERILIHTKLLKYEVPFDLKNFHEMCRYIYEMLSKNNMERTADGWFKEKFGDATSSKTHYVAEMYEDAGEKYAANHHLIWVLMILQFILVSLLVLFLWLKMDILLSLAFTIVALFMEYLGVLAITSPKFTRSVTIGERAFIIEFKKERVEIPFKICEQIHFHKSWPMPKQIFIFTEEKRYMVLPWYIKNFRGMCRNIYRALEHAQKEGVISKQFQKKYGNKK